MLLAELAEGVLLVVVQDLPVLGLEKRLVVFVGQSDHLLKGVETSFRT
ncbi:hypothetical protein H7142_02810 [Candidatus Saccharibacteria bacterium]|nr:hypothetical protein [Candidatus Saccharibacteria bacterium]